MEDMRVIGGGTNGGAPVYADEFLFFSSLPFLPFQSCGSTSHGPCDVLLGFLARVCPTCCAWILPNLYISSGFIEILAPIPTLRAALLMNETRFEYKDSWMEAARDRVRVRGTPVAASLTALSSRRRRRLFIMVAFMANLIQSRGINQMMF